jgi:hypothetical protein
MVKAPKPFVLETLWPEYQQLNGALRTYLDGVTDRIIADVIHGDSSEAAEVPEMPKLAARTEDLGE